MAEQGELNVGERLRSIRERLGLSLRALAARSGLSINAISQIERGANSPTVATLQRLSKALSVPVTDFFQDETRQTVVFVQRDLRLRAQRDGVVMESLGAGLADQQLEPFQLRIQPGRAGEGVPVSHPGQEFVHCLDGELEFCIGDRVFRLGQGDSLLFDATQGHTYTNRSTRPATLLMIFQTTLDRGQVQLRHLTG